MAERLQKLLAERGVTSRRKAEALIEAGRVTINGHVACLGDRAGPADEVAVDGALLPAAREPVYLALHKPAGVVTSARSTHGEPTVLDLLPAEPRVLPAGRLDKDTSGLLLLTNDGGWANLVTHPRHGLEKEYDVLVLGRPSGAALERMRTGVEIDPGVVTSPARVDVRDGGASGTRLSVTVMEGKKRQIRLMAAAVGHRVLALRRVRIGPIRLGHLPEGHWRALSPQEVESIREHARRSEGTGALPGAEDRNRWPGRGGKVHGRPRTR
jgi:pseudouridine synthase